MQRALGWLAPLLALAVLPIAAAAPGQYVVNNVEREAMEVQADPETAIQTAATNPQSVIDDVINPPENGKDEQPAPPPEEEERDFSDNIREAFTTNLATTAGVAGILLTLAGVVGFAFVTRYISPKEALKNPQRAMLYGFIRGNPGVHLKKLSEEFAMKTSSILWHIRKLESAELVHSERANGFRVFYPVDGGIEVKRVSRAITALQNRNARALYETVERNPGQTPADLADRLSIHPGTLRWHLRKLRDFGLVEELLGEGSSKVFPTPLGARSLRTLAGTPTEAVRPTLFPVPTPAE